MAALPAATLKSAFEMTNLALSAQHAQQLVQELTQEVLVRDGGELIGQSASMQALRKDIQLVAGQGFNCLFILAQVHSERISFPTHLRHHFY